MRIRIAALLLLFASPLAAQPNLLADVAAERATYPTPISGAQIGQLLNAVALKHPEFRLMAKPAGNNCPQPVTQTRVSCDILLHPPSGHWFDVLQDAEGDGSGIGRPQWSDNGIGDMSQAVAAVDPGQAPVPVPTPVPVPVPVPSPVPAPSPPPTLDLSALHQQIERTYLDLRSMQIQLGMQLSAHDDRLKKHDDEPGYLMKILGNRYVQLALAGIGAWFAKQELDQ